jgi:hypothetical protein
MMGGAIDHLLWARTMVRRRASQPGEKIFTPKFLKPPVDHARLIAEWLTL